MSSTCCSGAGVGSTSSHRQLLRQSAALRDYRRGFSEQQWWYVVQLTMTHGLRTLRGCLDLTPLSPEELRQLVVAVGDDGDLPAYLAKHHPQCLLPGVDIDVPLSTSYRETDTEREREREKPQVVVCHCGMGCNSTCNHHGTSCVSTPEKCCSTSTHNSPCGGCSVTSTTRSPDSVGCCQSAAARCSCTNCINSHSCRQQQYHETPLNTQHNHFQTPLQRTPFVTPIRPSVARNQGLHPPTGSQHFQFAQSPTRSQHPQTLSHSNKHCVHCPHHCTPSHCQPHPKPRAERACSPERSNHPAEPHTVYPPWWYGESPNPHTQEAKPPKVPVMEFSPPHSPRVALPKQRFSLSWDEPYGSRHCVACRADRTTSKQWREPSTPMMRHNKQITLGLPYDLSKVKSKVKEQLDIDRERMRLMKQNRSPPSQTASPIDKSRITTNNTNHNTHEIPSGIPKHENHSELKESHDVHNGDVGSGDDCSMESNNNNTHTKHNGESQTQSSPQVNTGTTTNHSSATRWTNQVGLSQTAQIIRKEALEIAAKLKELEADRLRLQQELLDDP
ncbi:hypothetical protein Pelo_1356 [Pelomyxa schiedti]|nr:hypothetical protein Pelo_1356 [Pelomyxa schiedti]